MKPKHTKILTKIHFSALIIALLNFVFNELSAYSLDGITELVIEISAVISGFLLFFFNLRPFKKINFYYIIYPLSAFLLIVGLIFQGLFWVIVLSIILYPIIPDQKKFEQDGIIISIPYRGFMAPCCSYQLKERKLLLFEKEYAIFESDGPIDFETLKMENTVNYVELTYKTDFGEETIKKKLRK